MHQYNIEATFGRIAIGIAGPLPGSERGNLYLPITIDYFTKRPEVRHPQPGGFNGG
jgi:hypothetical protein